MNTTFAYMSNFNSDTGLIGVSVTISGPSGDIIGRTTRGVRSIAKRKEIA